MRPKIFLSSLFMAVLLPIRSFACDQCACSGATAFNNLSVFSTSNYLMYRIGYASMHANEGAFVSSSSLSMDLAAGFALNRSLHIAANVPVRFNSFSHDADKYQFSGVGDMGCTANYIVYTNRDSMMARNKYTLSVRGGFELPTGRFNSGFREDDVPATVSTGSGSFDVLGGLRMIAKYPGISFTGDYAIKYNTVNPEFYRFGLQQSVIATASHAFKQPAITWLPYAGFSLEINSGDTYHDLAQHGTQGYAAFTSVGLECAITKWVLGVHADIPGYAAYDTEVHLDPRCSMRIVYLWQ